MPGFCVSLRRHTTPTACCGATPAVRTEPVGTVVTIFHDRRCRVGRVLRGPADMHRAGFEPVELTDRRQLREARR